MPKPLRGTVAIPCNKSIAHRAILFSALAQGESIVRARHPGRDNLASLRIIGNLGVQTRSSVSESIFEMAKEEGIPNIEPTQEEVSTFHIVGKGYAGLRAPSGPLQCGNSGTTARLLSGLLAGCPFSSTLVGDASLSARPFKRVTDPLTEMGASFSEEQLPFTITGRESLSGIEFLSQKPSAQVKSAILLAGLRAHGQVSVTETLQSRDHTERMFRAMGCPVAEERTSTGHWRVTMEGPCDLLPIHVEVPGDISSAVFFLVAGLLAPDSELVVSGVGLNKSRLGVLSLLNQMGADVRVKILEDALGEEVGDICVSTKKLSGIEIDHLEVAKSIDEIPILAVAAAFASGITRISGVSELRVKESDRLAMIVALLVDFGVEVRELEDGLVITGNPQLLGSTHSATGQAWEHCHDHRILMCAAVLDYLRNGGSEKVELRGQEVVETSFPRFTESFTELISSK